MVLIGSRLDKLCHAKVALGFLVIIRSIRGEDRMVSGFIISSYEVNLEF
jgi:hypothetical protein